MTDQSDTAPEKQTSPYVGPRPFMADDELKGRKLYGRTRETRRLLDLLVAERLLMLYSPSGAGKTSLLNAALIPRLKQRRFEVLPQMRVNQEPPQGFSLPPQANPFIFSLLLYLEDPLPDAEQLPLENLAELSLADYLERRQAKLAGLSLEEYQTGLEKNTVKPRSLVLIFDQFEEILTIDPTNQAAKEAFFEQVGDALRNRWVWAIFSLREDYIAGLDGYLRFIPTRLSTTFRLELLRKSAARQAIQEPARAFGKDFSDDAATKLVTSLSQIRVAQRDGSLVEKPGLDVEPVQLQVVCSRIWDGLTPEITEVTEEHIAAIGDVDTALADYYSDQVAAIATRCEVRERRIRDWFDHRLITGQGLRGQVLRTFDAEQGLEDNVIDALVDTYLVRSEERRGAIWLELAHDRLIQPVLDSNARWGEANLSTLQRQATLWNQQSRPEGLLLSGDTLAEAEQWAEANSDVMTQTEKDFLTRSRKAREEGELRLEAAENAARAEESAKSAASLRRRAIGLAVIGVVAVIAAIIAAVFGWQSNVASQLAIQQQGIAEAEAARADLARNEAVAERDRAATAEARSEAASILALEQKGTAEFASTAAIQQQQTAEAERDVARTAAAERDNAIVDLQANLETAAAQGNLSDSERASAEEQLIAVKGTQTAVAARSVAQTAEAERVIRAATQTAAARPVATATPNFRATATVSARAIQQAVTFPPPYQIAFVSNRAGRDSIYVMAGDGSNLRGLPNRGESREPDYDTGTARFVFAGRRDAAGGRTNLYSAPLSAAVPLNVAAGADEAALPFQNEDNWDPNFSPDGKKVAFISSQTGNWEIHTMNVDGSDRQILAPHPAQDFSPAWSPDGKSIVFASRRTEASGQGDIPNPDIWLMNADGTGLQRLTEDDSTDQEPSWSPDGRSIAFSSDRNGNQEIYIMDLSDRRNLQNVTNSPENENYPAWSPDGQWLAFSLLRGNQEIFVMTVSGEHLTNLTSHGDQDFQPVWIPR